MSLDKHLQNNSKLMRDKFLFLRAVVHSFPGKHDRLGEGMLPTEEQTGTTCQVPWMSFSDLRMPDASQQDMCEWKDSCLMLSLDCSSATWETEF